MLLFELAGRHRARLVRRQLVHPGAASPPPDHSIPAGRVACVTAGASAEDPLAVRPCVQLLKARCGAPPETHSARCKAVDLHSAAYRRLRLEQLAAAIRSPESALRRLLLWPGYDAGRPETSPTVAAAAAADTFLDIARSRPASGPATSPDALRAKQKRAVRCGRCPGCRAGYCGTCQECLDKPRFGGLGKRKKTCLTRMCEWTTRPVCLGAASSPVS